MWIQFALIVAVVAIGAVFMRRTGADSHLAIRRLLYGTFVIAAVLSILFPQWLTWFANLIGVGRGSDLLLYALIVMFLAFVYTQYRRNLNQQRQLTVLARRLALFEARTEDDVRATRTHKPNQHDV